MKKIKKNLLFLITNFSSFLFHFYLLIILTNENSEIKLSIQGTGNLEFINSNFYKEPSQVKVNGEIKASCKKTCEFENSPNEVIINFDENLNSGKNMFNGMSNILEIDLSNCQFSQVSSMEAMFCGCSNLKKINFGNIDTSSVQNMYQLFHGCVSLTTLDVSKFNTASVTSMKKMFAVCEKLISIDITNFNTQNVLDLEDMFGGCKTLSSIDFSSFDTSKVRNMRGIFYNCHNLKFLDLSNFSTDSLTNIPYTFSGCTSLIYLNLLNVRIRSGIWTESIFRSTPNYLKICISDPNTISLLSSTGKTFDCSDPCFDKTTDFKLDLVSHSCVINCDNHYEYENYCYGNCPSKTYPIEGQYLCLKNKPDGYYLDSNKYKKCFETCQKCENGGTEENNNCVECKTGYRFFDDSIKKNNCYKNCNNYYYFDSSDNYFCTDDKVCPEQFKNLIQDKNKCIDKCENDNIYNYIYEYKNKCYKKCPDNTFSIENEYICYDQNPEGFYLDTSNDIYKKCFNLCKYCNSQGNEINNNCKECISGHIFLQDTLYKTNCYEICQYYYYIDVDNNYYCTESQACPDKYKKLINLDNERKKCIDKCENDNIYNYKYEYKDNCYKECPKDTYSIENEYLCFDYNPEGYYLDPNTKKYKKCFNVCKYCFDKGNETINNCIECRDNYIHSNGSIYNFLFELHINGYKNCYIECPYYFYFDKNKKIYFCTENETCYHNSYTKLIYERKECVHKCEEDLAYRYEYKSRCYRECPQFTKRPGNNSLINEYFCKPICTEEFPFEDIPMQECIKNCPLKSYKEKTCILNYKSDEKNEIEESDKTNNKVDKEENGEEDLEAYNIKLQNFEIGFTSEDYDTSELEQGIDDIYEEKQITISLTTTQKQKDHINDNMTKIDLGECEKMLRKANNLSDTDILYMKKIDVVQEGMKIPKIEYDVYYKSEKNLKKLNLSVCEDSKIYLSIPILLTENLDQLNSSSGYYNDICYIAKSDSGTDIILKDRKKEFIEGNKTVCQDDCDFSEYDDKNQKVKCSCKVKESSTSFVDIKINKTKLLNTFVDIKNIANMKLMACYKELFSLDGIKSNIASYCLIPIIIFHIMSIIIFYRNKKRVIDDKIKDIAFSIKNWDLVKAEEIERKKRENMRKIIEKNRKNIIKNNKKDKKDIKMVKIINMNPIDFYFLEKIINKNNPTKKKVKINTRFNINNNYINNFIKTENKPDSNTNILDKKKQRTRNNTKIKTNNGI